MKMTRRISKTRQFLKGKIKISFFILKRILFFFFPSVISPVHVFKREFIEHNNQNHNVQYFKILDATNYKKNVDNDRSNIHQFENKYKSNHAESGFYKLANASVVSENAIAITSTGLILAHTFLMINRHNIENFDNTLLRRFLRKPLTLKINSAILISTEGTSGYYHWMIDSLPKLMMVRNDNIFGNPLVIIPRNDEKFIAESLAIYGFNEFITADTNFHCHVEVLYVPEMISEVGNPRLETIEFLNNLSIPFENQSKLFSKRVYVSRKNAKYRHILNENEFQTAISHLNFSTYLLEEMSLSDQISLFKNAEIIIASHGAGLTNIVYCQSRTKIIEFFPENYYEECYQNISSLLDLDHYIVIEDNGDTNYNFAVNIISALNLLKRII